jgi:hypothetical protein
MRASEVVSVRREKYSKFRNSDLLEESQYAQS